MKIKILELSASLDGGGVDKLLFDFCTRIMAMDPEIQFDFVVTAETEGMYEKTLRAKGCYIYHIRQMSGNLWGYIQTLSKIMKSQRYDIVHDHMNHASMGSTLAALLSGVPVRIGHAHSFNANYGFVTKLKRKIMALIAKACATDLCACSLRSGQWLWGNANVHVVNNAIDVTRYRFSEKKRQTIRAELGLEGSVVIGNVARFSDEKNHEYMLKILAAVNETTPAKLLLIGNGPLEDHIKELAREQGLADRVLFMGIRKDVPDLLNAMDVFILPSKFEGFPVSLVEAQANGLMVLASDGITDKIKLSDNFYFLPIKDTPNVWAEKILHEKYDRSYFDERINRYDMDHESSELMEYYKKLITQRRPERDFK